MSIYLCLSVQPKTSLRIMKGCLKSGDLRMIFKVSVNTESDEWDKSAHAKSYKIDIFHKINGCFIIFHHINDNERILEGQSTLSKLLLLY